MPGFDLDKRLAGFTDKDLYRELSNRGNTIAMFTPGEVGEADGGAIEDAMVSLGWDIIGEPDEEDE